MLKEGSLLKEYIGEDDAALMEVLEQHARRDAAEGRDWESERANTLSALRALWHRIPPAERSLAA